VSALDNLESAREPYRRWADGVREAFLEDVEWLLDDGISLAGLCDRFSMSPNLIEKRLRKYERLDLLDRLSPGRGVQGPRDLVAAGAAGVRVRELSDLGWTDDGLALRIGCSRATIQALKYGTRTATRRQLAERVLAVEDAPTAPRRSAQSWKEQGMARRAS
jgi:hypothetical protein